MLTIEKGRFALDTLIRKVANNNKENSNHILYRCRLGTKYIAPDADIVPDALFESGVVKLQRGKVSELTEAEKAAIIHLKKPDEGAGGGGGGGVATSPSLLDSIRNHDARKRKRGEDDDAVDSTDFGEYHNADFILASAAEVERLWSIAKYILVDQRKGMTPQMFEALLFLKVNARFWNQSLVSDALSSAKTSRSEDRLSKLLEQQEIQGDEDDLMM
jgi:hypothetical protein